MIQVSGEEWGAMKKTIENMEDTAKTLRVSVDKLVSKVDNLPCGERKVLIEGMYREASNAKKIANWGVRVAITTLLVIISAIVVLAVVGSK